MKYLMPLAAAASLGVGAVLVSVVGHASAANLTTAVVKPTTTFQCSDGCSLPGVLNVDPQGVAGPDVTDPALRVGRWARTVYISCRFDATGDGVKYRVYVDDREWTGQWWIAKTNLQSPDPARIDDRSIPRCPDFF
ncbi:MAG TPA: hypothetical protein VI248_02235 [Kineosporiaceae bacterium]